MPSDWYWPNSAGTQTLLHELAGQCAADFPEQLLRLARIGNGKAGFTNHRLLDNMFLGKEAEELSDGLAKAFTKYGSDKSTVHNYHRLYGSILSAHVSPSILEIGLGSNDTEIASNMGEQGRPGASIRAFREIFEESIIHGADFDRSIEIENESVFFVDQTKPDTFDLLCKEGAEQYDLIIDDGLHAPNANINSLTFALSKISPSGAIVIEDIPERALDVWELISALLDDNYRTALVRTNAAYVFICTTKSSNLLPRIFNN
jgi:hypothetical protein